MHDERAAPVLSRAFLFAFSFVSAIGFALFIAAHFALARAGALPPPPHVATWCIDKKLDYLSTMSLGDVEVAAIGSSAAWKNLDMAVFADETGRGAINAGACNLYINQTDFYAKFLLPRLASLQTLILGVLPRDFEDCRPANTAFFDPRMTGGVIDGYFPRWLPYITGFRPIYLMQHARRATDPTSDFNVSNYLDGLGSEVFAEPYEWWPELEFSDICYASLTGLEIEARARGVRLVVAIAPIDPAWQADRDPEGRLLAEWRSRLRRALPGGTLIVDGNDLGFGSDRFADPMHIIHPHQITFSHYIASKISGTGQTADPPPVQP